MKPKMARKPRPTDEVSSPPLSPTSGRMVHKKRRIESESSSPVRKQSTASMGEKACKQSPKGPKHKEPAVRECKVPKEDKPMSPLPPIHVDDQQPCSSTAPITTVQAPPEFLAFDYNLQCPTLRGVLKAEETLSSIKTEVLRALQHELEAMLAHTMDFMRRAAGDLQFLETGDYPMVNLKNRAMPCYQMRQAPNSPMSPTTQVHHEISLRSLLIPAAAPDEDVDVWPPPHLATRYQSYLAMEKEENVIDRKALDEFAKFMDDEMNEVDLDFVTVRVPEYRNRLRYASMLDVFSEFERRLHDHALQLQQMNTGRSGGKVVYNNCARSSTWWSNPIAGLGAAEAFSRNFREKRESFIAERRVKMMRVNLLPSLSFQSLDEKRAAAARESALRQENEELKEKLKKAEEKEETLMDKEKKVKEKKKEEKRHRKKEERRKKEAEAKVAKEKKKAPVTPSKDTTRRRSNSTSKPTASTPSSSRQAPKPMASPSKTTVPSTPRSGVPAATRKPLTSSVRPVQQLQQGKKTLSSAVKAGGRLVVPDHLKKEKKLVVVRGWDGATRVMGLEEAEDWAYGQEKRRNRATLKGLATDHALRWNATRADVRVALDRRRTRSARRVRSRAPPAVKSMCGLLARRSRSEPHLPVVPMGKLRMDSEVDKLMRRLGVGETKETMMMSMKEMKNGKIPSRSKSRKGRKASPVKKVMRKPSRSPVKKTTAVAAAKPKPTTPRKASPQKQQQPAAAAAPTPKKPAAAAATTPKKTPAKLQPAAAAASPAAARPQRTPQKAAVAAAAAPAAAKPVTPQAMKTPTTPRRSSPLKSPVGSPTKPAPALPKSPVPSPTTSSSSSSRPQRRAKAPEGREQTPDWRDEMVPNGVEKEMETPPTQRRSTRDRKPSLKIQQSQLPIGRYFQSNSRKSSANPEPTPEPVTPSVVPVPVANGVGATSPTKEEMPVLSPMGVRSRRMTRNSMDAAMVPPVLQVQQVLLLQQQPEQPLQLQPVLSPPPQLSPHKKESPRKIPNGLTSPMTRRRASIEEKQRREREEEIKMEEEESLAVIAEEKKTEVIVECNKSEEVKEEEKEEVKRMERTGPPKKPQSHKSVKKAVRPPPTTSYLCIKRLRELKKAGEKVCMRVIRRQCRKRNITLKIRVYPRSMMKKRAEKPSKLDKKIDRLVTPSPTRYMLSEAESRKMGLILFNRQKTPPVEKKICKKVCLKKLAAEKKKKESEMRKRKREKQAKAVCWMVPDAIRRQLLKIRIMRKMRAKRKEVMVIVHRSAGAEEEIKKKADSLLLLRSGEFCRAKKKKVVKMVMMKRGRRVIAVVEKKEKGGKPSKKVPSKTGLSKKKRVTIKAENGSIEKMTKRVIEKKRKVKKEKRKKEEVKRRKKEERRKKKEEIKTTPKKPAKSELKSPEKKKKNDKGEKKKNDEKKEKNIQISSGKEGEKKEERKKRKKEKKQTDDLTATVLFKGRMPKLIDGMGQLAQFVKKKDGKPLAAAAPPSIVEEKKKGQSKPKSAPKNGQKRLSSSPQKKEKKTKKVGEMKKEEEEKGEKMEMGEVGKKKEKRRKEKKKREEKRRRVNNGKKRPNRMRRAKKKTKTSPKKGKNAKKEKAAKKRDKKKLSVEQIRTKYMMPLEDRLALLRRDRKRARKGRFIRMLRAGVLNRSTRAFFVRVLRVLRRIRRRRQSQAARVIPSIDMSVPHLNDARPGAGWPVEWTIQKSLRAPGVYPRRKLKAVRRLRRARERREREREEEKRRVALAASDSVPLRKQPWELPVKRAPRGSVNVLKSVIGACHMEENDRTARVIEEIKWRARKEVMDVIFDSIVNCGQIHNREKPAEPVPVVEEQAIEMEVEEKAEVKKEVKEKEQKREKEEARPRRNSIRGRKEIPVKEETPPPVEEEEEEEEKMDVTLEFGDKEEEEGEGEEKAVVPLGEPYTDEDEVSIELAIAQHEYKKALESYHRTLSDIFHMMGAHEAQRRARKYLEEKEDELYSLHAKFYREVPRRLPNNQEMALIALALSERRQAMIEVFGANLWRQPRIQPDHPAWLTAEYKPGAKRQDKYNFFVDWDFESKKEVMRAHEKLFAVATSHHLSATDGYSAYTMGRGRDATTLYEWEKECVAEMMMNKRKCQKKVIPASAPRLRDIPKRPLTAAALKKQTEEKKKREKEEEKEREREASGETYSFGSEDDDDEEARERRKEAERERDEWDEEEERKRKERESTPPIAFLPEPTQSTGKRRQEKESKRRKEIEAPSRLVLPSLERRGRIVLEPEDVEPLLEIPSIASSVSSILGEYEEGGEEEEDVEMEGGEGGEGDAEVKEIIRKMKKDKRVVMQDDKKVDRRKVGGLDLPVSISHLDPSVFLELIPDNRSHKKGQGKKAMLKQIMIEYAAKEKAAVAAGKDAPIPRKPNVTQQQLMSPGGTTVISGGGGGEKARSRRSLISPQGSERSERSDRTKERDEKEKTVEKSGGEKKSEQQREKKEKEVKKKREKEKAPMVVVKEEPMDVEEEEMPSRQESKKREPRAAPVPVARRLSSPLSTASSFTPKAYGARRACTRKVVRVKEEEEEEDDDFGMKVPYTPAARRGGPAPHSPAVAAAAAAATVPATHAAATPRHHAPLSPLPVRSCRRRAPAIKYDDDDEPVILHSAPTTHRMATRAIKQEIIDDDY